VTRVSVIIETVTVRYDHDHGPLCDAIAPTMAALESQTCRRDLFEILIVLDPAVDEPTLAELSRRFPALRQVRDIEPNYFAEKNAGVRAAQSPIVVWLDADCVPGPDWLETLIAPLAEGAQVATGETRYQGGTLSARTFSVSDFATVSERGGKATGIMLNNVALPRELALRRPLDARIRRNGGCFLLYHQLLADGVRMVYVPEASVTHELDVDGVGFVRKHFDRGYDAVTAYRCDDTFALRGTRLYRRLGPIALPPLAARRMITDVLHLFRSRRHSRISLLQVPYYAGVMFVTRTIELAGSMLAGISPRRT
jgi:GT2 family glycosyltransferase